MESFNAFSLALAITLLGFAFIFIFTLPDFSLYHIDKAAYPVILPCIFLFFLFVFKYYKGGNDAVD